MALEFAQLVVGKVHHETPFGSDGGWRPQTEKPSYGDRRVVIATVTTAYESTELRLVGDAFTAATGFPADVRDGEGRIVRSTVAYFLGIVTDQGWVLVSQSSSDHTNVFLLQRPRGV